jgi:hypothetical protein
VAFASISAFITRNASQLIDLRVKLLLLLVASEPSVDRFVVIVAVEDIAARLQVHVAANAAKMETAAAFFVRVARILDLREASLSVFRFRRAVSMLIKEK